MNRLLSICVLVSVILTACGNSEDQNNKHKVAAKSTLVKTTDKENQGKNSKENREENKNKDTEEVKEVKGDTTKENTEDDMTEDVTENNEILDEYLNLRNENPIDRDYHLEYKILNESGNYTDKAFGELREKYIKIWDTELNAIYNKLLGVLQEEEKELLIESQKGWLQLNLNEPKFFFETFRTGERGSILGTVVYMQLRGAQEGRIRSRTLELIKYYYLLGNGIDFDYESQYEEKYDEAHKESDRKLYEERTDKYNFYVHYDADGQYYQVIYGNPIDHDFDVELERINNSSDYSIHKVLQFQYKYNDIWDNELNIIYNKLLKELNEEEKALLVESQMGWVQFHMNEEKFFQKTFYERESGPILGSIDQVQMLDSRMVRIKSRTLELKEYYYHLGEYEIEFEYESQL